MHKTYNVLIVDDDEDDQLLIKLAFAQDSARFVIHSALDGTDVLENIEDPRFLPDLILLDLNMPRLSGFEVLKHLKSSALYQHIPIVILTTSDQSTDIDKAYEMGANSFITKPINHRSLVELVGNLRTYWFELAHTPSRRTNKNNEPK